MKKVQFRGISINPFDKWVFGSLVENYDDIKEETTYYIQGDGCRAFVLPESICRMVAEFDGLKFFDKDIIEYDHDGLRRIEPIIDDSLTVYIGRSRNNLANSILGYHSLNITILGNTIENPELLNKEWTKINTQVKQ